MYTRDPPLANRPISTVLLNVYDVVTPQDPTLVPRINDWMVALGMGVFHTGVEVCDTEFAFGGHVEPTSGVFEVAPKKCGGVRFRKSLALGLTALTQDEVRRIAARLGNGPFLGPKYSLISHNCNHFSKRFLAELGIVSSFPAWVNRLAGVAGGLSCLLPEGVDRPLGESVPVAGRRPTIVGVEEPRKPPRAATVPTSF